MLIRGYNAGYEEGKRDIQVMGIKVVQSLISHTQENARYMKGYLKACDEYMKRREGYDKMFGEYLNAQRALVSADVSNKMIQTILNADTLNDKDKDYFITLWHGGVWGIEDILDKL